jgi:hypothetical protein
MTHAPKMTNPISDGVSFPSRTDSRRCRPFRGGCEFLRHDRRAPPARTHYSQPRMAQNVTVCRSTIIVEQRCWRCAHEKIPLRGPRHNCPYFGKSSRRIINLSQPRAPANRPSTLTIRLPIGPFRAQIRNIHTFFFERIGLGGLLQL